MTDGRNPGVNRPDARPVRRAGSFLAGDCLYRQEESFRIIRGRP